jgi:hypothetical protein
MRLWRRGGAEVAVRPLLVGAAAWWQRRARRARSKMKATLFEMKATLFEMRSRSLLRAARY